MERERREQEKKEEKENTDLYVSSLVKSLLERGWLERIFELFNQEIVTGGLAPSTMQERVTLCPATTGLMGP